MSGQFGMLFRRVMLSFLRKFPITRFLIAEWYVWRKEQEKPGFGLALIPHDDAEFPPYPLDMWFPLDLPHGTLDEEGVPCNAATEQYPAAYHPTTIAQYGLAQWNMYLTTRDEKHQESFLIQAQWLVDHESFLAENVGGWPIPFPVSSYQTPETWLSALTQGHGLSVLVRAYALTNEDRFLQAARRAIHTFNLDIQKGGVRSSIDGRGVFFEEVAVDPPAHILNGYILALIGLYDYVTVTGDVQISELIQCSLATLHSVIDRFDTGYWSCYDLRFRHLASQYYHRLHIVLLEILAQYSGCVHCATLASLWDSYQRSPICCLRYFIVSRSVRYYHTFRRKFLHASSKREITAQKNDITLSPLKERGILRFHRKRL